MCRIAFRLITTPSVTQQDLHRQALVVAPGPYRPKPSTSPVQRSHTLGVAVGPRWGHSGAMPMTKRKALSLADYYGGDQIFDDERDHMSEAMYVLAKAVRRLERRLEKR